MDRTANRELRHDRHTVSLLSDHMVFAPKYRGKILIDDVAMVSRRYHLQDLRRNGY